MEKQINDMITDLFSDTSVPVETTLERMQEVRAIAQEYIDVLEEQISDH